MANVSGLTCQKCGLLFVADEANLYLAHCDMHIAQDIQEGNEIDLSTRVNSFGNQARSSNKRELVSNKRKEDLRHGNQRIKAAENGRGRKIKSLTAAFMRTGLILCVLNSSFN